MSPRSPRRTGWLAGPIRTSAFVRKELVSVLRQPRLVLTVIIGPFLILLIFGLGYRTEARALRTLFVVPEGSPIAPYVEEYASQLSEQVAYLGTISDAEEADRRLRNREVDLVVVVPSDPAAFWQNNEQAELSLFHYEIDPFEEAYVAAIGQRAADAVNQRLLLNTVDQSKASAAVWREDISEAQQQVATVRQALGAADITTAREAAGSLQQNVNLLAMAVGTGALWLSNAADPAGASSLEAITQQLAAAQEDANALAETADNQSDYNEELQRAAELESDLTELEGLLAQFQETSSGVLVQPFRAESYSITNVDLQPTDFYVPAVIALLLQHIAISLAALSIVREKQEGPMEYFRAAPVTAFETLLGKYLSFFLLTALLAAVLTALVVLVLGAPMLGAWGAYAAAVAAVLLASLGVGFHMSLSAKSNSQAIQYAMIVLLASIFFSGFFLPLYRLYDWVQIFSWMLPATYGTDLLQSIMLRGRFGNLLLISALYLIGLLLLLGAWLRLRRQMSRE